jgi:hypothetical protein
MNYLNKLLFLCLSVLSLSIISCSGQKKTPKPIVPEVEPVIEVVKKAFVDPTRSMNNKELQNYDSLFNTTYSIKLNNWKKKYQDSLNCEIVFHSARDGYALCINFINFNDSAVYSMNLDGAIEDFTDEEFSSIEMPINYIHTRRIINWEAADKFNLRFCGATYQQYQFRSEE